MGWKEIGIIVVVIIILFGGAKQIPKIMRSLGEGLKEFKKSVKDVKENIDEDVLDDNDKKE